MYLIPLLRAVLLCLRLRLSTFSTRFSRLQKIEGSSRGEEKVKKGVCEFCVIFSFNYPTGAQREDWDECAGEAGLGVKDFIEPTSRARLGGLS